MQNKIGWDEPFIGKLTKTNIASLFLDYIFGGMPRQVGETYVSVITDIEDNKFDICLERPKDYSISIKDMYGLAKELSSFSGQHNFIFILGWGISDCKFNIFAGGINPNHICPQCCL